MRSEQEVNNEVEDIKKVEGKEEEHKEELDRKDLHKGEEEKEEDMEDVSMRRWVTVLVMSFVPEARLFPIRQG